MVNIIMKNNSSQKNNMFPYDVIPTLRCTCLITTKLQEFLILEGYLTFCEVITHPQSSVWSLHAWEGGAER